MLFLHPAREGARSLQSAGVSRAGTERSVSTKRGRTSAGIAPGPKPNHDIMPHVCFGFDVSLSHTFWTRCRVSTLFSRGLRDPSWQVGVFFTF